MEKIALPLCAAVVVLLSCCGESASEVASEVPIFKTEAGDEMVIIPGGKFQMGSDDGESHEKPVHEVEVSAFLMDRYEVTQKMFARLELSNPSHFKGEDRPADNLTWVLAAQFCNARSEAEGLELCYHPETAELDTSKNGYRLPTEAEWEYACRAGGSSAYAFGSDPKELSKFAWYGQNANKKTHPVGKKRPNGFGLYDMLGNVAEWCNDAYDPNYYAQSPRRNPMGPKEADLYVTRGGSWKDRSEALRSSARGSDRPGFGDACLAPDTLGLRCVRAVPAKPR